MRLLSVACVVHSMRNGNDHAWKSLVSAARAICLAQRIDALTLAFSVELDPDVLRTLDRASDEAEDTGQCQLSVRGLVCELKATRKRKMVHIKNADMRAQIDLECPANEGGWNIEVILDARYLAASSHEYDAGIVLARQVAGSFGVVHAERLRRVDLCADFLNFDLSTLDPKMWLLPKGAKRIAGYYCDLGDKPGKGRGSIADINEWRGPPVKNANAKIAKREAGRVPTRVTGYTICPGNTVVGRIYDKTQELKMAGREEKRSLEESIWKTKGWKEGDKVTRAEFQLRGVVLDEMELRDPKKLVANLDGIWQRMTRWWTRLIVPKVDETGRPERRTRCPVDDRWRAVQQVSFQNPNAQPIARVRRRGGATWEQAWGSMCSALAGAGALPLLHDPARTSAEIAASLTEDQARGLVTRTVCDIALTFGMNFATHALGKARPNEVAYQFVSALRARRARFASSLDDQAPMQGWELDPLTGGERPQFTLSLGQEVSAPACGWVEYSERCGIIADSRVA